MRLLEDILVQHMQEFFRKQSLHTAIIGISGGVDSAVTATLAVRALGKENVFALRMPHKDFSSPENLHDAREVCELLQIPSEEKEISPFCDSFFREPFVQKPMTKGNIMARVRMILLYALANEKNGIVLGTGNKTELLTGFFTKYGDGGVDIEVLGEVWKTEVFAMAKRMGLPKNIHTKAPTAELFLGQTDEKELGISYPLLDSILQKIDANKNFLPQTEEEKHVWNLVQKSAHKRGGPPALSRNI